MSPFVPLALFGWLPVGLVLFQFLRPRHAVLVIVVAGWLLLPVAVYDLPALPGYSKTVAVTLPALLGALLFDTQRVMAFRLRWFDVPMIVWCLSPMITSVLNGLGIYNGISVMVQHGLHWAIPYFLGRIYFCDREGLNDLALAMFIGGLVYVPLCLYEIRMSPQLHNTLYGFHPMTSFAHVMRYGGYKPVGFLPGGIALALWLAGSAVVGLVLWLNRARTELWGLPVGLWLIPLWITFVLSKSIGAVVLALGVVGVFAASLLLRTRVFLLIILLAVPAYLSLRIFADWHGDRLVALAEDFAGEGRAGSLSTRLRHERLMLQEKMNQHFFFGWGAFGRSRVENEMGNTISVTDSLWMIVLGRYGLVGLTALFASLLLPIYFLLRGVPPDLLLRPSVAPALAVALGLWIFVADRLLNAQPNPVFVVAAGGLIAVPWHAMVRATRQQQAAARAARGVPKAEPVTQSAGEKSVSAG